MIHFKFNLDDLIVADYKYSATATLICQRIIIVTHATYLIIERRKYIPGRIVDWNGDCCDNF